MADPLQDVADDDQPDRSPPQAPHPVDKLPTPQNKAENEHWDANGMQPERGRVAVAFQPIGYDRLHGRHRSHGRQPAQMGSNEGDVKGFRSQRTIIWGDFESICVGFQSFLGLSVALKLTGR